METSTVLSILEKLAMAGGGTGKGRPRNTGTRKSTCVKKIVPEKFRRPTSTSFAKQCIPWNKGNQALETVNCVVASTSAADGPCESDSTVTVGGDYADEDIKLVRPRADVYAEAAFSMTSPLLVPSKLRPEKLATLKEEDENACMCGENIIINIDKLQHIIEAFYEHSYFSPACTGACPTINISERKGLCLKINVTCKNCTFETGDMPTYHEVRHGTRGPATGTLNDNLLMAVMKSRIGVSDATLMLSCLNVQAPAASLLYAKVNRMSDNLQQLNETAMLENVQFVRDVNTLAGRMNEVDIATDTAFNNRPQAGYEAATQSVAIVTELNTSKKLPLTMQVANKLCPKRNCNHDNCKKNYDTADSISSSESKLAKKNLEFLEAQNIIKIKSVTCDASAQLSKTVREHSAKFKRPIKQYTCFVHFMRTVQKHVKNVSLQSTLPGNDKPLFLRKLSASVRERVRMEVTRIRKNVETDEDFVTRSQAAVENIIPCFHNNHENCKLKSLVCISHLSVYKPKFLPYGKHLELCDDDQNTLTNVLTKSLSAEKLEKISRLLTTNKCESLHHRIFTIAPKNTLWSRNFAGLSHSAVHSSIHGTGKSILKLATCIGMKYNKLDPIYKHMIKKDRKACQDKQRKSSRQYKHKRYLARKQKCNRKLLQRNTAV
jgi:hypothetical protein